MEKAIRIVNSFSWDLKSFKKMEVSVIYSPQLDNIMLMKFFFFFEVAYLQFEVVHKGEKYSLRNTSRMQSIESVGHFQHKHNLKTAYFVDF